MRIPYNILFPDFNRVRPFSISSKETYQMKKLITWLAKWILRKEWDKLVNSLRLAVGTENQAVETENQAVETMSSTLENHKNSILAQQSLEKCLNEAKKKIDRLTTENKWYREASTEYYNILTKAMRDFEKLITHEEKLTKLNSQLAEADKAKEEKEILKAITNDI